MGLRIACDLDGTVADMDAALEREARRLFGADIDLHAASSRLMESAEDGEGQIGGRERTADEGRGPDQPSARSLTRPELRRLWDHVGKVDDFWRSLGEIEPGALARFSSLAFRHRWEVLFLTQRPPSAGETAQVQSHRWLQTHGFDAPSVFVMNGSRGRVAQALSLDAVLDDRPENCLDVLSDSKATPFLIWRLRRDTVPPGVGRTRIQTVFSMGEALDRLEQLTAERSKPNTILARVRAAMGLD